MYDNVLEVLKKLYVQQLSKKVKNQKIPKKPCTSPFCSSSFLQNDIAWSGCVSSNIDPWPFGLLLYSTRRHEIFQTGLSKSESSMPCLLNHCLNILTLEISRESKVRQWFRGVELYTVKCNHTDDSVRLSLFRYFFEQP